MPNPKPGDKDFKGPVHESVRQGLGALGIKIGGKKKVRKHKAKPPTTAKQNAEAARGTAFWAKQGAKNKAAAAAKAKAARVAKLGQGPRFDRVAVGRVKGVEVKRVKAKAKAAPKTKAKVKAVTARPRVRTAKPGAKRAAAQRANVKIKNTKLAKQRDKRRAAR